MERGPGNWPVDTEGAFRECRDKLDKARKEADHWRDNHKTLRVEVERLRSQKISGDPVFVVQHSYPTGRCDEIKFIGVYRSHAAATNAVGRLRTAPGFREHPDDFTIDEYRLDADHWVEGFVTD
ncbi:MAG TPA: hypothetical protein VIT43_00275 [Candidatus Dormibacteraeota bacterium]